MRFYRNLQRSANIASVFQVLISIAVNHQLTRKLVFYFCGSSPSEL